MKRNRQSRSLKVSNSRWLAYATAGAASALASVSSVEGEIHYSGRIDVTFPRNENKSIALPLDQPGDSIIFARTINGGSVDFFGARGLNSGAFLGSYPIFEYAFVWRIKNRDENRYISRGHFTHGGFGFGSGTMVRGSRSSLNWRWHGKGTDFVGFRFDNGSGRQYGWVRVHMDGAASDFSFTVVDYAWADPGEPIKAGQTSSDVQVPEQGSLGWLAAGAAGLLAWRKSRSRST